MALDSTQFATILNKIDTLELFGAIAVIAVCVTLFVVGYMGLKK